MLSKLIFIYLIIIFSSLVFYKLNEVNQFISPFIMYTLFYTVFFEACQVNQLFPVLPVHSIYLSICLFLGNKWLVVFVVID